MKERKILVLGISESVHTTARILEELNERSISYIFIKWSSLIFLNGKILANGKELKLKNYSAAFYDIPSYYLVNKKTGQKTMAFDLDNELDLLLKEFKKNKLPAINRDFLIDHPFYNKFTQSIIFGKNNIAAIPTLHLADNKYGKVLKEIKMAGFKFPLVVKESDGGLGEQVHKIGNAVKLEKLLTDKRNVSLVYQPFIKNSGDFRVIIIGKKSIGIMKRSAQKKEWRNNFALGGKIEKYEDRAMEKFAEKVCRKMGIEYAGVDILKTEAGYLIIEINSFARFEGFEKTHPEKNIAKIIINYLLSKK